MILVHDFKPHIDDTSNSTAVEFLTITESFNVVQHISGPTHSRGYTLDPNPSYIAPEAAPLRFANDLLMAADSRDCSVLVLLYLSAASDAIDHATQMNGLKDWVGISGTALEWFSSYLSNEKKCCVISVISLHQTLVSQST